VRIIDFMPLSNERCDVLRIVEGFGGRVAMHMELIIRFDYGYIVNKGERTTFALNYRRILRIGSATH